MIKHACLPGLLSGILLGLTTIGNGPVYHLHWAIFFGFVPLWSYWLRETCVKKILFSGWVCQFTFTLVAFHWIAHTVNEFSHMGAILSVMIMLAYCAMANLQFPLAGFVWNRLFRNSATPAALKIAGLALFTAAFERIGTMIFHWNFGYAWLYMRWPGMQLADVTGFRWLCTFSICLNGFFLYAWLHRRSKQAAISLSLALGSFLAVNALGAWRLSLLPPPDAKVRVLMIQTNVGNREKEKLDDDGPFRNSSLTRYFALTDRALKAYPSPDFAVWPENTFPGFIVDPPLTFGLTPKLKEFVQSRKLNLLTGGYGITLKGKVTNGIFAIHKSGLWLAPAYEKRILLPFGEYIPGGEKFPILKTWLPDVRDYGEGSGPLVMKMEGVRLGGEICYEGLFDFVARDLANSGAQLILNITNDSWYGEWMEPWQHFYITMAKAIETRRPLIRDTNTGISAVAFADGSITELSPMGVPWFQLYEIPYLENPPSTIFMRWGYWFDTAFLALGVLLLIFLRWKGRLPSTTQETAE